MNLDELLNRARNIIQYIEDRIFLRNLILAFFVLVFGMTIVMQILKIYTRHNQELSVPDFSGLSIKDAADLAHKRNLKVVVFDSVYMNDFERGTVVDQHPKANFKVKKNRKVFLTMNAMKPEKIAMPNLVDLTFRQARAKIESFGLKVGRISYEPDIAINVVLAQRFRNNSIAAGDSIIKGSSIDLVLGKGLSDEQTAVPNLIGHTFEEAKLIASDRFLSIGAAVKDISVVTDEDQANAIVFRQKPAPGRNVTLQQGSSIDVWITLDSTKVSPYKIAKDTFDAQ